MSKPCCTVIWEKSDYTRDETRSFGEDDDGNDIIARIKVKGHTMTAKVQHCPLHKSAPDLLEALVNCVNVLKNNGIALGSVERAESAIAKAGEKGEG